MIVDAHLHIWRQDTSYPNPTQTIVSPYSDIPLELFKEYMTENSVDRAVLVQPLYPGEDNSYVADCAQAEPDTFAAVCVIDPNQPDALINWPIGSMSGAAKGYACALPCQTKMPSSAMWIL